MIKIYTDGSCIGNPGPGGWGVLIKLSDNEKIELTGNESYTTNNKMELTAALEALKWVQSRAQKEDVLIYTDSTYVKTGITQWIHSWKQKGWKNAKKEPVKNQELWVALDTIHTQCPVKWQWVKAHNGHPENEYVDQMAYKSALKSQQEAP